MRPVCLKDIPHASGRCGEDSNLRTPIGKYLRIRPNHFPHSSIGWHGDLYLHPTVSVWAGWLHRPMSFDRMKSCLFLYIPNFPHYQTGVHVQYLLVPWMVVWFSKVFGGECHHRCFHDWSGSRLPAERSVHLDTPAKGHGVHIRQKLRYRCLVSQAFHKRMIGNFFPSNPFWCTKWYKISWWIYNWFIPVTKLLSASQPVSQPGQLPPSPTKRCNCDISKMARVPSNAATRPVSEQPYWPGNVQGRNSPKSCPQWKRTHNKCC